MVEGTDTGWLVVLEKNGLGPAAAIFENYGIDSETDLLVLDQDDVSKLASRGLKPLYVKKLERWCGALRERAENMLPSSLKTPAASAVLSSEALNVVTPAAHSVGAEDSECESGAENESERDGEDDDDSTMTIAGEVTYTEPEVSDLSKPSASMGKFLTDAQYAFTLEPYVNGTPAPTLVTKEADMAVAAAFLLVNPDFSKTEVVKAYAHSIVAPAIDYWKQTIEGKKGDQLERMKAVRIFNPLHVLGNKISEADIDGLKIFKFYEHPEIRAEIQVMKTEVMKYQALAGSIKSFEERKDSKGKDTFVLSDWWKSNCVTLPGFTYVLRAVLTNSPNSCPPERLFSIFNATYGDDQKNSHADYIELSMQSQFNKRGLR
jgi:hypothetical protein